MKPRIKSMIWNIKKNKTFNQNSKKKKESKKIKDRLRSLWDDFKCTNIRIIGVLEGEQKEQEIGNLFGKIMKENLPNLVKEIDIQVQEAQRPTPRHIIIKMPKVKDKEKLLKATREKKLTIYRGVFIRLCADFSKEILWARRNWQEIFKVVKSKDLQLRLFYPAKLSFRMGGQIKYFPDKVELKEFITTKTLLPEMLKGTT